MLSKSPKLVNSTNKYSNLFLLVLIALSSLLINITTLFRRLPSAEECGNVVPIIPGIKLHRFANCDEPLWLRLGEDPLFAINPDSVFQSRPFMGVIAWIVHWIFAPLEQSFSIDSTVLAYISINWTLLILTIFLSIKLLSIEKYDLTLVVASILFFSSNPITKAFFWTAHVQIFIICLPVISAYICVVLLKQRNQILRAITLGLSTGLLSLAYSSFLLIPFVFLFIAIKMKRVRIWAVFAAFTLIPVISWQLIVRIFNHGFFYSHEVACCRQFIWVFDSIESNNLISTIVNHFETYSNTFGNPGILFPMISMGIVIISLLISIVNQPNLKQTNNEMKDLKIPIQSTFILLVSIYVSLYFLGFYQSRLSWGLISAIFLILILLFQASQKFLNPIAVRNTRYLILAFTTIQLIFWMIIPGPWA